MHRFFCTSLIGIQAARFSTVGLLLLLTCFSTIARLSHALVIDSREAAKPASPAFSQEPPSLYLLASADEDSVTCLLDPSSSPASAPSSVSLRWRYEEFAYNEVGVPRLVRSDYAPASTAGGGRPAGPSHQYPPPPSGFYDAGSGRLVFVAGDNEADFITDSLRLPRYKLYCEARTASDAQLTVMHSRKMVVNKISNLLKTKAQITCQSGPAGGSAKCTVRTDLLYTDYFNVSFYRQMGSKNTTRVKLEYNPQAAKFAVFENGFNELHIMNLNDEDAKYGYMSQISLARVHSQGGVYTQMSTTMPIQVLQSTTTLHSGDSNRLKYTVHEVRPGLEVALPCYKTGQGRYAWLKDGRHLAVRQEANNHYPYAFMSEGSGNLLVRVRDRLQAGVYECQFRGESVHNVTVDLYSEWRAVRFPSIPEGWKGWKGWRVAD